jgi:hypothetical protein
MTAIGVSPVTWRGRVACVACCAALLAAAVGAVRAQVVLSEVMFDPSGSEFYDEFIELQNLGPEPVDLAGWRVGDGVETDALRPVGTGTVLRAGAFALVLDSGYGEHSSRYDPLPDGVLLLTIEDAAFGRGGLSNAEPEAVVLVSASGDTVARMTYTPGNAPGRSEEKVDPGAGDGAANWMDARWDGGTPGRLNSVSPKAVDLAVAVAVDTPVAQRPGAPHGIPFEVSNVGRQDLPRYTLTVSLEGADPWTAERPGPAPGAADVVTHTPAVRPAGPWRLEAHVAASGDQDPTNDGVSLRVLFGARFGQVAVSEVMFRPADGRPEWVELRNLSDEPVNLVGWRLLDAAGGKGGLVPEPGLPLAPRAAAVLAEDAAAFRAAHPAVDVAVAAPDRWPRLNDGGDRVVVRDATGALIDSVAYPKPAVRENGRSFERIDLTQPGTVALNWLLCTDPAGATPGAENSVSAGAASEGVALSASPNPFRERVEILLRLPVTRAHVNLWVYDRAGRRVASLLDGAPGGASRRVVWRGTGDGGAPLRPGLYVLLLEARSEDGRTFRARKAVVLARGL